MKDQSVEFPKAEVLNRLALSDSGFVFDPVTGNSFSLNATGLAIVRRLQRGESLERIVETLQDEFEVEPRTAERDLIEFATLLRGAFA